MSDEALGFVVESMLTGLTATVERQEKAGQAALLREERLPKTGLMEIAEKMGIEIVGDVPGDPLFCNVRLPEGWTKRATDHSMWSHLVDPKGRARASIFYKAAFYDRDAFIRPKYRFYVAKDYDLYERTGQISCLVHDRDAVIWRSRPCLPGTPKDVDGHYEEADALYDEAHAEAVDWLSERYPDWQNWWAHWDDAEVKP